MNIKTNEPLVSRNRRIAQITSIGGLAILVAGMFISFRMPQNVSISFSALIVGFLISQIGIYYTNRWGRKPRPDELINQALKGLDNRYNLIHYFTPTPHLLIGPAGIWILSARHQKGVITFSNGRWHQKGGNLYLKIFGQEGLGRPDLELQIEIEKVQKYFNKIMPEITIPPIQVALIFTNSNAVININESDPILAPTLQLNKLKEFIRKIAKNKPVASDKIEIFQNALSQKI